MGVALFLASPRSVKVVTPDFLRQRAGNRGGSFDTSSLLFVSLD